jgi:hypothetical protein
MAALAKAFDSARRYSRERAKASWRKPACCLRLLKTETRGPTQTRSSFSPPTSETRTLTPVRASRGVSYRIGSRRTSAGLPWGLQGLARLHRGTALLVQYGLSLSRGIDERDGDCVLPLKRGTAGEQDLGRLAAHHAAGEPHRCRGQLDHYWPLGIRPQFIARTDEGAGPAHVQQVDDSVGELHTRAEHGDTTRSRTIRHPVLCWPRSPGFSECLGFCSCQLTSGSSDRLQNVFRRDGRSLQSARHTARSHRCDQSPSRATRDRPANSVIVLTATRGQGHCRADAPHICSLYDSLPSCLRCAPCLFLHASRQFLFEIYRANSRCRTPMLPVSSLYGNGQTR